MASSSPKDGHDGGVAADSRLRYDSGSSSSTTCSTSSSALLHGEGFKEISSNHAHVPSTPKSKKPTPTITREQAFLAISTLPAEYYPSKPHPLFTHTTSPIDPSAIRPSSLHALIEKLDKFSLIFACFDSDAMIPSIEELLKWHRDEAQFQSENPQIQEEEEEEEEEEGIEASIENVSMEEEGEQEGEGDGRLIIVEEGGDGSGEWPDIPGYEDLDEEGLDEDFYPPIITDAQSLVQPHHAPGEQQQQPHPDTPPISPPTSSASSITPPSYSSFSSS